MLQATIYVTPEAYETAQLIKDLDYFDRTNLCEEYPDLSTRSGYHLKNANLLHLAVLPADASIVRMGSTDARLSVSMPADLRGCIFEGAPNLPSRYADIVSYWSGQSINAGASGAVYFQCKLNEYMVDLGHDPIYAPVVNDRLLSEGVVVLISGMAGVVQGYAPESYVEIAVLINPAMLGSEPDQFASTAPYAEQAERTDSIFLKVADILASPDPDRVYIDLLNNELIDYGYWY